MSFSGLGPQFLGYVVVKGASRWLGDAGLAGHVHESGGPVALAVLGGWVGGGEQQWLVPSATFWRGHQPPDPRGRVAGAVAAEAGAGGLEVGGGGAGVGDGADQGPAVRHDVHSLVEGYALVLGGVHVSSVTRFDTHSDGDVLSHALVDALAGAIADGDLGTHFPEDDPEAQDARSLDFETDMVKLVRAEGFEIANVDSFVVLQGWHAGAASAEPEDRAWKCAGGCRSADP